LVEEEEMKKITTHDELLEAVSDAINNSGLNPVEIAARANMSVTSINSLKGKKTVPVSKTLMALFNVLGVTMYVDDPNDEVNISLE
jgi:ribosome-binding protein aMBF1 (putative translation factor)